MVFLNGSSFVSTILNLRRSVGAVFMNEIAEQVPVQLDEILVPLG